MMNGGWFCISCWPNYFVFDWWMLNWQKFFSLFLFNGWIDSAHEPSYRMYTQRAREKWFNWIPAHYANYHYRLPYHSLCQTMSSSRQEMSLLVLNWIAPLTSTVYYRLLCAPLWIKLWGGINGIFSMRYFKFIKRRKNFLVYEWDEINNKKYFKIINVASLLNVNIE